MVNKKITTLFFLSLCANSALVAQNYEAQQMSVSRLMEIVESNSRTVKISRLKVDESREALSAARDALLPDITVSLSGSYNGNGAVWDRDFSNYHKAPIPHWGNSFALQARQTVYSGGAVTAQIGMAETQQKLASVDSERARQQASFVAIGMLLDIAQNDNAIRVYERNIALTEELINNVRSKYDHGTALKNDITRQELILENQRLALRQLRDAREIANSRLCAELCIDEQQVIPDTTIAQTALTDYSLEAWMREASVKSTRLQMDSLSLVMAQHQLKASRSRLLPKLSIVAEDNLVGPVTIEIPAMNNNFNYWFVGIGVSYELSSLFKGKADVRKSRTALRRAQTQWDETRSNVGEDVDEAFTLYEQSKSVLRMREKNLQLAEENYQVVSNRYLSDLALTTDMTDAENLLLQSELDMENARIAMVYAYYKLKYMAGKI